jgi:NADH dehydrogenase
MSESKRIVILGGGFGGVYTAIRLEKLSGHQPMEVTLINRSNYFLMTPLLFEAGSGVLEPRHAVSPIRSLLKKTRFVQAEIQSVDLDRKIVFAKLAGDELREIPFDQLVVAVGGTTNTSLVRGSEHALTFKTLGDAIFLRNRTIELFERAALENDPARRAAMLRFVIVGAGLVGTELAAELAEFVHNVVRAYKQIAPAEIRFDLIEAGKRIMPEIDPELSDYATRILTQRGINVRGNTKVKAIEPGTITIDGDPPETIPSNTIIVATGVTPSPLVEKLNLEKNKKGRIVTDATMRVHNQTDIWALGDCAAIPDPSNAEGRPYPQLAQHALREAKLLADNIVRSLRNETPQPFIYSNKGVLAALGQFRGVGRIYKFRIFGFPAWWVWRTYYLLQMPRWPRRVRIMIDWTIALFFNNDIVELDLFGQEHPLGRGNDPEAKGHG